MSRILITGGGGFIGSQVALAMSGRDVTIVDRMGKKPNVPGIEVVSDYVDFFSEKTPKFDTIIHLAAEHVVEQSVTEPAKFYTNNVIKMKQMLDCAVALGVKNIIFSSSGCVYGAQGQGLPLTEDLKYAPYNTYASTKVAGELLLRDYERAYGLKYVTFRYFNAAGADPELRTGYTQRPATHVIPILCNKILNGNTFTIFGNDYDTKDGTCVRDYVHVADIANAHVLALEYLNAGGKSDTFNIGTNTGTSVKELVDTTGQVLGVTPNIQYADRRDGDTAVLVANADKAFKTIGWKPNYSIKDAIQHAWDWEKKNG